MEHNITFEELWQREEQQGLVQRMQHDYPRWQRQRKRRLAAVAAVAVLVVAVISPFTFHLSPSKGYDAIACNRSGIAEDHWAKVAANILIMNSEI